MPSETIPRGVSAPARDIAQLPTVWLCAILFLLTLLAYAQALTGSFIWDDSGHVTRADLRSLDGLFRIWFEPGATQQYYPLLHTGFWIQHALWGDATPGYHLVNVALHAGSACLFAALLRRLSVPGAWLAACLFALHPVSVESVAWISEQKNTLSTLLYLGSALFYLRFDESRRSAHYLAAALLFAAALASKTVTATLPAALLVVLWWRRGSLNRRGDVLPLLPWFALSAAAAATTAWMEHSSIGAQGSAFELGFADRIVLAGRAVWFYAGKLLWPANLSFIYPKWTIDASAAWQWLFPIALAGAFALLVRHARRNRAPLAVGLLFVGTLFPALGFVDVYPFLYSYVADHFQYLASLSLFAAAGAGCSLLRERLGTSGGRALCVALLALLGFLTWKQGAVYKDVYALYEDILAKNPGCWMARNNLGIALLEDGRIEEAAFQLEEAIKVHPEMAEAQNNLGNALTKLKRYDEARLHLERALKIMPRYPEAHNNLGVLALALEKNDEALAHFNAALKLNAKYAVALRNRGYALAKEGRVGEAIPSFEAALRCDPDFTEAHLNLAVALMLTGRFPESAPHFERALALDPDNAQAHNTYGRALAEVGRFNEAIVQYDRALRLSPDFEEARVNLAIALKSTGRDEEAEYQISEVRRLRQEAPRK